MEGWPHKSENIKPKLETGEQPGYHKAILVAPGFEVKKIDPKKSFDHKKDPKKEHRTGLLWETRIKLLAAFSYGKAEKLKGWWLEERKLEKWKSPLRNL